MINMELWIRSQDKLTLMETTYVYVAREEVCAYDENKCWSTIGVYETQERALEVLDEIQNLIKPIMLFQNCECDNDTLKAIKKIGACMVNNDARIGQINQTVFYEMPEE